jgi:hypothetical protein
VRAVSDFDFVAASFSWEPLTWIFFSIADPRKYFYEYPTIVKSVSVSRGTAQAPKRTQDVECGATSRLHPPAPAADLKSIARFCRVFCDYAGSKPAPPARQWSHRVRRLSVPPKKDRGSSRTDSRAFSFPPQFGGRGT